jgi:immune inhibitor A
MPLTSRPRELLSLVPPSPELLANLHARYQSLSASGQLPASLTFDQFFAVWATGRRGPDELGLDDGMPMAPGAEGPELIDRPLTQLKGAIRTIVLLVDFPDRPAQGTRQREFYEQMLFGEPGIFPSGSMRDYYRAISKFSGAGGTGIDVVGEVQGWLRMPQPLTFYASNTSGMTPGAYPRNAQGLARDAVEAALAAGIDLTPYDVLSERQITALFVVHAGRGAETTGSPSDLWSLKWTIPTPVEVGSGIVARTFLTVPEDCNMGVCAHEWGHLAARWADYYDTDRNAASRSRGLGNYCLMAGGSWGNGGLTPVLPNGMLRTFHGWIDPIVISSTTAGTVLHPAATPQGTVIVVQNPARMTVSQYVLIEYRRRRLQDAFLPDEGIAVYVVDESIDNVNDERRLAIELLQADGKRDLAQLIRFGNGGDTHDLYPYEDRRSIGAETVPPLNLPNGTWTGIVVHVKGQPGDATMTVDVEVS